MYVIDQRLTDSDRDWLNEQLELAGAGGRFLVELPPDLDWVIDEGESVESA